MKNIQIPQLIPFVGKEEIENLEIVIRNKWITEGPFSQEFIKLIKDYTNARHALLVNNGTLGLFLALMGLGIKENDEVIVPDFTFIASGSSIVFAGGTPVFIDVNPNHYQIEPDLIEKAITKKTKAIMPVHIYGQCVDMDPILDIANKYGIYIIEDAAQSFGVFYKGKHTGTIGDLGVISFFADKTITTGEGAVILTNNDDLYEKLKLMRNQGRPNSGTFIHPILGMNFRLTDLQCAVGVAQIKKIETIINAKIKNYQLYKSLLSDVPQVNFIQELDYCNFVPFRSPMVVENCKGLVDWLEKNGIQTRGYFYPLHKQPCFRNYKYENDNFKTTNFLNDNGLAMPVYPGLLEENIIYICNKLIEYYAKRI